MSGTNTCSPRSLTSTIGIIFRANCCNAPPFISINLKLLPIAAPPEPLLPSLIMLAFIVPPFITIVPWPPPLPPIPNCFPLAFKMPSPSINKVEDPQTCNAPPKLFFKKTLPSTFKLTTALFSNPNELPLLLLMFTLLKVILDVPPYIFLFRTLLYFPLL